MRVGKLVGCAAIVVAAVITLGLSVHNDVQFTASVTTAKYMSQSHHNMQRENCIYSAIRSHVPKGAPVYTEGQFWTYVQRLAELSTSWAVPQAKLDDARWRLTLVPARAQSFVPARGLCGGLRLKVTRV